MWRTRQFLRERRPWPSPDLGRYLCGPYTHMYVCVYCVHACARGHTRSPLPFAASLVRTFGPEESKEGQQRQEKKTGRGRISRTAKHVYLVEKYLLRSLRRHSYHLSFSFSLLTYLGATIKIVFFFSLMIYVYNQGSILKIY